MKFILDILKGMVIGIANVIPGVSGGTMAVSMGIYDKLIHCITHLFKEFKKSIIFVLPIVIGMGIAIGGLSFVIPVLFEKFPMPTTVFFIGLILGGIPIVFKKTKGNKFKAGYAIAFLAFFALVIGMALLGDAEGVTRDVTPSFTNVIILLFIGIIASATMIVPGVSGSMVLLVLGYYNPVITAIKDFLSALAHFDTAGILRGIGILLPFGIGIIIGIFAIAKLIEMLFEKFPQYTYWAIIGLLVASPIAVWMAGDMGVIGIGAIIASVIALAAGFVISMKLGE